MPTLYQRLGLRPFINARGTITTLGGSIMPAPVVEAMAEAARQFVHLNELHERPVLASPRSPALKRPLCLRVRPAVCSWPVRPA